MNKITVFMFFLFVIGVLLTVTSFMGFSKLDATCKSTKLRNNLRICICIGAALMTMFIMYMICTKSKSCSCDFSNISRPKMYLLLIFLIVLGGVLLYLSASINAEIKSDGCNVDLGGLQLVLLGIAVAQIALPSIYLINVVRNKQKPVKKPAEKESSGSTISQLESARAEHLSLNKQRSDKLSAAIAQLNARLAKVNSQAEDYEVNNKDVPQKLDAQKVTLETAINRLSSKLSSISSDSSSLGRSSGQSSGRGGFQVPR